MGRVQKNSSVRSSAAHLVVCSLDDSAHCALLACRLDRQWNGCSENCHTQSFGAGNRRCRGLRHRLRCYTKWLPTMVVRRVRPHLRRCWLGAAYTYQEWHFPEATAVDGEVVPSRLPWVCYFLDGHELSRHLHCLPRR